MKRVDNDLTKGIAVPFLILGHVRTGGTFLCHALSNHPQIFCDRGETLHHLSNWKKAGIQNKKIMLAIWKMDGYRAAGFRSIYQQIFIDDIWNMVKVIRPKIIHLTRENLTRQGVSMGYQQMVRARDLPFHPVHSFTVGKPDPVEANPKKIVWWCKKVREEMGRGKKILSGYPGEILEITYEQMTGDQNAKFLNIDISTKIQKFFNVDLMRVLPVELARDFDCPMREWFSNWDQIKAALKAAKFGGLDG